ncbi:hypothetical protein Pint_14428 [Pistacia integerrima]|uniref:Uncharacterized protein n=1 Tax=Pistacia integerrima TaxID=434235 RepID=A0ACC0Y849_9ROSI|nr:hypothetical protein Pint_14428 [Pistacia integerrima]
MQINTLVSTVVNSTHTHSLSLVSTVTAPPITAFPGLQSPRCRNSTSIIQGARWWH